MFASGLFSITITLNYLAPFLFIEMIASNPVSIFLYPQTVPRHKGPAPKWHCGQSAMLAPWGLSRAMSVQQDWPGLTAQAITAPCFCPSATLLHIYANGTRVRGPGRGASGLGETGVWDLGSTTSSNLGRQEPV